jgi:ABC-type transport system involved in multi-copper enzyme maturation permease subunit
MLRLLRSETFRLRRRWMPWVLLLLIVLAGVGLYLLVYAGAQASLQAERSGAVPPQPGTEEAMNDLLRQIRPANVQGFGVSLVSGIGSVMLIAGFGVLFIFIGMLAAIAGSYIATTIAAGDTSGLDVGAIAQSAAKAYYTFLPYMALAALIAVWSRSAGAGIAAGLVLYFAEGLIAGLLVQLNREWANIVNYGLSRNVTALTRDAAATGVTQDPTAVALPDQGQAALVLAIYTVVFVALAFWRLRTRDITLG